MRPRPPHSPPHLYDEADDDDLMFACADCGCSSCLYDFDIENARAPGRARGLAQPRWRRPTNAPASGHP